MSAHLQSARADVRYHHDDAGVNSVDKRFYNYLSASDIAKVRNQMPDSTDLRTIPDVRNGVYSTCGLGAEFLVGWRVLPCYSCEACDGHASTHYNV